MAHIIVSAFVFFFFQMIEELKPIKGRQNYTQNNEVLSLFKIHIRIYIYIHT